MTMMTKPTTAIIDGDIIAYRSAYWADGEGIDDLPARIKSDLKKWTPSGCDEAIVAMSCPREYNYRREFWPKYKAHRDNYVKPDSMDYALEIIYEQSNARCVNRLEADDLIGIMVSSGDAIGVTVDKDLRQVPGWHWNPDKEKDSVHIPEAEADRFFYKQWMTGDSTDNIWGLWRVGPKSADKILDEFDSNDWEETIINKYLEEDWDKRPDNRTPDMNKEEYSLAQARCVRILRSGDYDKDTKEINLWLPTNNHVFSKENGENCGKY